MKVVKSKYQAWHIQALLILQNNAKNMHEVIIENLSFKLTTAASYLNTAPISIPGGRLEGRSFSE